MSSPRLHASPNEPAAALQLSGWPLLRLGFRPFYVGAAAFALLSVPLWVAVYLGHWHLSMALPPLLWHAHEMLFGFAVAVILGFLLTAVKAWTGLATPRGAALGALALLWLTARVAAVTGPYTLYAVLDLALLPLVAAVLTRLLLRARNRRNLPLAAMLMLLALANGVFHLGLVGVLDVSPLTPLYAALALVVMIECVIAGRVIPAFTMNATPGLTLRVRTPVERAALALTALALLLWVFGPAEAGWNMWGGFLLLLAALAQVGRLLPPRHPVAPAPCVCVDSRGSGFAGGGPLRCAEHVARRSCPGHWCHGWADHRHDDPHRPRPYRARAAGFARRGGSLWAGHAGGGHPRAVAPGRATLAAAGPGAVGSRLGGGLCDLSLHLHPLAASDTL